MRRRIIHFLFVTVLGTVALVGGVVAALTLTPLGRRLLARNVSIQLDRLLAGNLEVGSIGGSFLGGLDLTDLVVHDTTGVLLARLPRVRVTYRLPNLLAGRIILATVDLEQPELQIIKYRNGRLNYQDVLHLGQGGSGGPSPLIELRDLRIHQGTVILRVPWSPQEDLATVRQVDSALAAERARPGRIIQEGPDGLQRLITLRQLTTRIPRLTIATPDHQPVNGRIDTLAADISDPGIQLRQARARFSVPGDTLRFQVERGALPNTRFSGGGLVMWPHGPVLYDFQLDVPQLDLADIRWISPDFPALTGRTRLTARSITADRTAYLLDDLELQGQAGGVRGRVTALVDSRRGLGVDGMRLTLDRLDLDAVRPYLDTLPLEGTLSGALGGAGFFDGMNIVLDWRLVDTRLPDRPESRLAARGHVILGGPQGMVFDSLDVSEADIALATVRLLSPAVQLTGRLAAQGRLRGPWRNARFDGTARQQDGELPASQLSGRIRLDTRGEILGVSADVELAPLAFASLRPGYPALRAQGELRGHARLEGTLDRLAVEAEVAGQAGAFRLRGTARLWPPRLGGDSLLLEFRGADLATLLGEAVPATSLTGRLWLDGVVDSVAPPEGRLELSLGPGRIREFPLDTLTTTLSVLDGILQLDTLEARWTGGTVAAGGRLGWRQPIPGGIALHLRADSLTAFDSLLLAVTGLARDTTPDQVPLDGVGEATLTVHGSLDSLAVEGGFQIQRLAFQEFRAPAVQGRIAWLGGGRPRLDAQMEAREVSRGDQLFRDATAGVAGWVDSLDWRGAVAVGTAVDLAAAGRYWQSDSGAMVRVRSFDGNVPGQRWRLTAPATLRTGDSLIRISPLELRSEDGSGLIRLSGDVPSRGRGALLIEALGVGLPGIYGLLQRDTTGLAGSVGADLAVGGTAAAPTIRGTASLADASFGEFRAPFVQGVVDYADRRLDLNLFLWKTGKQVLRVEAALPIDLAFRSVPDRQVAGSLSVRALADSADLGILEAFTPNLRRVRGTLDADAQVTGSWDRPQLGGFVEVRRGRAAVPALGVNFGAVAGRARLSGDSIVLERWLFTSGGGQLNLRGGLRLENLARPILDLQIRADRFRAMDVRNFLTLEATGDMALRGPLLRPTLTGAVTANAAVLYFADLLNKRIIDLEDPANADLIDLESIRRQRLGANLQSRILDSLRIVDLGLTMGDEVWLRSAEANIQMGGQIRVNKVRDSYRLDGSLSALRGSYTLKIGFVSRDFSVERGTVSYLGTPDLNADLDIQARHVVRPVDGGEEIPIVAKITGTLQAPKLTLESGGTGPQVPEADLVSYLMFGKSSTALASGGGSPQGLNETGALVAGLSYFSSALSSELERALITDIGVPVDFIEIRPGLVSSSSFGSGGGVTQVVAGWQLGPRVFLTFNAGFCTVGHFTARNPGAGLEYRFNRSLKLQASFEPVQGCLTTQQVDPLASTGRYQIGFDLLWEREY